MPVAKPRRQLEIRMTAERVPHGAIQAKMVEKVIPLKNPMVLDHPMVGFGHIGFENHSSDVSVIGRAERVADVVQERADDVFLVHAIPVRQGRRLQGMG